MAEEQDQDKTEAPSQKRLEDAFEKGDVPRSPEITSWAMIGAMAMIVSFLSGSGVPGLSPLSAFLAHAGDGQGDILQAMLYQRDAFDVLVRGLGSVFAVVVLAAVAGSAVQHRIVVSLSPVTPKLSNLSPLAGLKRIFGAEALIQFAKTILKMGAVGSILVMILLSESDQLSYVLDLDPHLFVTRLRAVIGTLIFSVFAFQTLIAGGDYLYRFLSWYQRMRMTRTEMKEEYKQQEGSPEIRQKLRQLRRDFAKRGMMKKVPRATVIVTNPTHFAVALHYEKGMAAPVCLAKAVDVLALRIRAIAEDHRIPIVEDPPLARSLYRLVEIDEQIPLDLYMPVAEIIGYVMRLKRGEAARYAPGRRSG